MAQLPQRRLQALSLTYTSCLSGVGLDPAGGGHHQASAGSVACRGVCEAHTQAQIMFTRPPIHGFYWHRATVSRHEMLYHHIQSTDDKLSHIRTNGSSVARVTRG